MISKEELQRRIEEMKQKLQETRESAEFSAGPVRDALRIVIPMMEDQLQLMDFMLDLMED